MPIYTKEMLTVFKIFIVILSVTILKVNILLSSCLWHSQITVKESFVACLLGTLMHSHHNSELCPKSYPCVQVMRARVLY